ncbi:hypothetical protein B0H19DRAFT_1148168 [Mycena capillaripes]|nr:hypothetical protein B0H19DRAFT_1148168 [Mycena capillaripes]
MIPREAARGPRVAIVGHLKACLARATRDEPRHTLPSCFLSSTAPSAGDSSSACEVIYASARRLTPRADTYIIEVPLGADVAVFPSSVTHRVSTKKTSCRTSSRSLLRRYPDLIRTTTSIFKYVLTLFSQTAVFAQGQRGRRLAPTAIFDVSYLLLGVARRTSRAHATGQVVTDVSLRSGSYVSLPWWRPSSGSTRRGGLFPHRSVARVVTVYCTASGRRREDGVGMDLRSRLFANPRSTDCVCPVGAAACSLCRCTLGHDDLS